MDPEWWSRRIMRDNPPWLPFKGSTSLDVWHMYDFPRVGLVRDNAENLIVFMLLREENGLTIWQYWLPSEKQARILGRLSFSTVIDMHTALRLAMEGSQQTIKVSARDLKIYSIVGGL